MFRLFAMSDAGRLFQLGSQGWVTQDGTNFPNLTDAAKFVRERFVPALPCGSMIQDSFVALVAPDGAIRVTFDYGDALDRCAPFAECEG